MTRDRIIRLGGVVSGIVLIAFGVAVIVLAVRGNNTVTSELKQQQITGTPDMTPAAITTEVNKAGLKNVTIPSCDVAGKAITNGSDARCFAQYMNIHALLATGGYVYSQMGIYTAKPGTISYMATQLALFSLVVGVALLLSGVGFIVLALGALPGRRSEQALPEPAPAPA